GRGPECYDELPRAGGRRGVRIQAGIQVLPARAGDLPGEPEGASRERAGAGLRERLEPAQGDPDRDAVRRERTMCNKSSKPQNHIDSLIGATTRIEGNVI